MYTRFLARLVGAASDFRAFAARGIGGPARAAPPVFLAETVASSIKIQSTNERLEMTIHTSRILTMDQKIPQAQVNNPDILDVTPLSPNRFRCRQRRRA